MKQIVNERTSATGPAYNTPLNPKKNGNRIISGVRNKTCLVSDMKIPLYGFPIAVKKLEVSGCKKAVQIPNKNILKYLVQKSKYNSEPEPKIETIWRGKSWKHNQLIVVMIAANLMAR